MAMEDKGITHAEMEAFTKVNEKVAGNLESIAVSLKTLLATQEEIRDGLHNGLKSELIAKMCEETSKIAVAVKEELKMHRDLTKADLDMYRKKEDVIKEVELSKLDIIVGNSTVVANIIKYFLLIVGIAYIVFQLIGLLAK